jgi:hypothetical protein
MKNACAKIVKIIFVYISKSLKKDIFPNEFEELKEFKRKIGESTKIMHF